MDWFGYVVMGIFALQAIGLIFLFGYQKGQDGWLDRIRRGEE